MANEEFVRQYAAATDVLGKRITLELNGWAADHERAGIVGVVGNLKYRAAETEVLPQVYLAVAQRPQTSMAIVVRTDRDPAAAIAAIRGAAAALDRHVPVQDVRRMDDVVAHATSRGRFIAALPGGFAAIALVLAAVGVYGVAAHSTAARVREFAIRMALGAGRRRLLGMVLREAGVLAGVAAMIGARRPSPRRSCSKRRSITSRRRIPC